jgi:predicted GNAT family acetyltransferase
MHVTDANMHVTVPTCDFAKITCQHVWQSFTHMLQNSNMHVAKFQHGVSNIRTWRFKTPNMHVTDMNINVTDTSMHVTDANMGKSQFI